MVSGEPREVLRPSILARLTGRASARRAAHEIDVGIRELRREVTEHLELLLNTRINPDPRLEAYEEAKNSVLTYGLADMAGFSKASKQDLRVLAQRIEEAIRTFEPRLNPNSISVRVEQAEGDGPTQAFNAKFRIDAELDVHPHRDFVSFDTNIEFSTGAIEVGDQG